MNKLYVLGALALSGAHAYVNFLPTPGTALAPVLKAATADTFNSDGLAGTYTYTYTGDCIASATAVTLGLNNNYYQYYTAALSAGTWAYASASNTITYTVTGPVSGTTSAITVTYSGCYHAHIYNWLAMPSMSATGAVFKGGQYQSTDLTITETAGASTTILPVWGQ